MDTIVIRDLTVFYRVGVTDEERAKSQRLSVSIELDCDFSEAAATDDLHATIDYFAVSRRLLGFGDGREWRLIEKLASDIAEHLLAEYRPKSVSVEVRKFIVPEARYVAVRLKRTAPIGSPK